MPLTIDQLGPLMLAKRGSLGVRAAAHAAGVTPATFSRVENGHMPDLKTFAFVCKWLERDPSEFLGLERAHRQPTPETAQVHLRKKKTASKETAESLGALIIAVQEAARAHNRTLG